MLTTAVVFALLVAQEPMAVPSPQPSPLKQIIDVKARALCTTLGKNVQVALVGLMKNDEVVEAGRREFVKMAWDRTQGSNALAIDRLALKNVATAMVHNLERIDEVLSDPQRFPASPSNEDERAADRIKAALQAVEDRQKVQLNVISGTVETDELSGMRHDFAAYNPTVNNPNQSSVPLPSPPAITDAGIAQPKPAATVVPATNSGNGGDGVAATSPGATFAQALANQQSAGVELEREASAIIVPIAQECRAAGAGGSPGP